MNCECLEFNESRLIEHYKAQGVVNPRLTEEFLGINMSTGEATISLLYTVHGDNRPYNSQKGKPCHMVVSFCPWCGKPTKSEVNVNQSSDGAPSTEQATEQQGGARHA